MESVRFDRQRGQILVQVALMVVVLFAFVALALDVGHVYAGRRRMQNAADAGALAGARAICFDGASAEDAEEAARQYAVDRNGSKGADIEILDGVTVTVVTSQTLDTFFAGLINIDTAHVQAEAEAVCRGLVAAGAGWPLAFDFTTYYDVITCTQEFLIFDDKNLFKQVDGQWVFDLDCAADCCDCTNEEVLDGYSCAWEDDCDGKCECPAIGTYVAPGNYGWLEFPDPEDMEGLPPDDAPPNVCNPGSNWVDCWIRYDYPDLIDVGECIRTEEGIMASLGDSANARAGRLDLINPVKFDDAEIEDPFVNIILYEEFCDDVHTEIRVAGFGCVEVLEYNDDFDITECGSASACKQNLKVIKAKRVCEDDTGWDQCRSHTGAGGAGDSESLGVSLTK